MSQRVDARKTLIRMLGVAAGVGLLSLSLATSAQADPSPKPRGPHDKVPAGSVAVLDGDELIISTPRKDGGNALAFYSAETSAQDVLTKLKTKGVVGADIKAMSKAEAVAAAVIPGPGDPTYLCPSGYGTASYIGGTSSCGLGQRVNWRNNSFSDPQVYFRDHTSARWPVTAAISSWSSAVGVDVFKSGSTCPTGGRHCVHAWNANYGAEAGWSGYTYAEYDSSYYFIDGAVVVHFNDYVPTNATLDRKTACHELGHALGLHHNSAKNSCMYGSRVTGVTVTPSTDDFNTLRYVIYP